MLAKSSVKTDDDDYNVDDLFMDKAARTVSKEKQQTRDRQRAIAEHQRREKALESCMYCMDGDRFKKHLLVSLGSKIVLMLPDRGSLCEGHCLLVPTRHVSGMTALEEDEYDELEMFKKCLVDMFAAQDKDVVFTESSAALHRRPHAVLHCVPLSRDDGAVAPMFFKVRQERGRVWRRCD